MKYKACETTFVLTFQQLNMLHKQCRLINSLRSPRKTDSKETNQKLQLFFNMCTRKKKTEIQTWDLLGGV